MGLKPLRLKIKRGKKKKKLISFEGIGPRFEYIIMGLCKNFASYDDESGEKGIGHAEGEQGPV